MQRKLVCTSQAVAVPMDFFVAHDSVVHDVDIPCEGSFMELTPHPGYKNVWSAHTKEEWNKIFTSENLPRLKP
jgi:virulence-associated protein VagC